MIIYAIYKDSTIVYIGQTRNKLNLRLSKYRSDFKLKKSNTVIARAILKHSIENFKFEPILSCTSLQSLNDGEITLIALLKPRYNVSTGGVSNNIATVETRAKIGEANRRRRPHQFRVTPILCTTTKEYFCSTSEAARHFGIGRRSITNAVNGWCKTAGGLEFKKCLQSCAQN
jgi:group I intron endonuclease